MTPTIEQLEVRLEAMNARGEATRATVDLIHELSDALLPRTPERIQTLNEEALALARQLAYRDGVAFSLLWIGFARYMQARYAASLHALNEALALFEETANPRGQARIYTSFVFVQQSLGNHDEALAAGLKAIPLYEALPVRDGWYGWNQLGLGSIYLDLNDYERALETIQQGLAFYEEIAYRLGQARALTHLATIYQRLARHRQAIPYLEQSLACFRAIDDPLGASRSLNDLGSVYRQLGDADQALALYQESLHIREAIGNRQAQCTSLINLGRLCIEQQDLDGALPMLHRALDIAEDIQAKPKAYQAHEGLAAVYEQRGDLADALHHYQAFHRLKEVVVGEEAHAKFTHLQISYAVEKAEHEAEIERLKNVELKAKNDELERLLNELKTTQAQLVQSEKLASLGRLTAGIAHEIKNPLNFVNNFSQLSVELADELADELVARREQPVAAVLDEAQGLLDDLKANAAKIHYHGVRADGIVQAMMDHARGGEGERRTVDVNALVEEYVTLAYHGKRAATPGFNVTIERDYDEGAGAAEMVPQEIGRVLLNLFNNAFEAVYEKAAAEAGFAPTVRVRTRRRGRAVEIQVRDNGPGIEKALKEKIFEPFFTTKPAGTGTGLGLSLSYDIVTQGHGGTLTVARTAGGGATFKVTLPTRG